MPKYNVSTPIEYKDREGNDKTFWQRLGKAFPAKSGGIMVTLNALPLPGADGRAKLFLAEDDGEGGGNRGGGGQRSRDSGRDEKPSNTGHRSGGDYDDDVPF